MRLEMSRSAASAGLLAAMTARTFYGLTLDAPEVMNAAWLAALMGGVLALPVVWLLIRKRSIFTSTLLCIALAVDGAKAVEWTAFSESCLAFDHTSPVLLMLPLLLALARCTWLGGGALGGAARIWARISALLVAVLVLCQLPYYKICWLAPWLGNGAGSIFRTALRTAGWIALLCGAASEICDGYMSYRDALPYILIASGVSALLLALSRMMWPIAMDGAFSRQMYLDALLTNGQAPITLQLPMIIAWFVGMLHLMAFEAVAVCGMVHRLLPGMGEIACIVLGLGALFALALLRVPNRPMIRLAERYLYHIIAVTAMAKEMRQKCAWHV